MTSPVLRVRNLSFHVGGLALTNDVSIDVMPGERRGIMGPNGAGKTTLFNLIAGVLKPSGGRIELSGQSVTGLAPYRMARAGVARTFQVTNLLARHTVGDNLALAVTANHRRRRSAIRRWRNERAIWDHVEELVERGGLADVVDVPVQELAYGVQRKLEIVVALAQPASVIMLDEPGAGLNSTEAEELIQMVFNLRDDIAVLFIDHDVELVLRLATSITMLDLGSVVAEGTPDEMRASPIFRQAYMGQARHA